MNSTMIHAPLGEMVFDLAITDLRLRDLAKKYRLPIWQVRQARDGMRSLLITTGQVRWTDLYR